MNGDRTVTHSIAGSGPPSHKPLRVKRQIARTFFAYFSWVAIVLDFVNPVAGRAVRLPPRCSPVGSCRDAARSWPEDRSASDRFNRADHGEARGQGFVVSHGLGLAAIIEHDVEMDSGTRLVGAALVMPKIDEAFPAGRSSATPRRTT